MDNDLQLILERISHSDGAVKLNDLSEKQIQYINDLVMYRYQTQTDPDNVVRFGDKLFRPKDKIKGVSINTGNNLIDYQIKSIMLLAMHIGLREGGGVMKFSTLSGRARILIKFYKFVSKNYNLKSFFDFSEMNVIKSRTIILHFLMSPKASGGMECSSFPSNAKSTMDALKNLTIYDLAKDDFLQALREICSPRVKDAESEEIRHSVIPTQIMKQVVRDSIDYLGRSQEKLPELTKIFEATTERIKTSRRNTTFQTAGIKPSERLYQVIDDHFKDVRLHVFTLILAFTGMRDLEAVSIKNNSHRKKKEDGEWHYFVNAMLKKTDEGEVELDWVANKEVYEAIDFLSKINELNHNRARALIARYGRKLGHGLLKNYKDGLNENLLFGSSFTVACRFVTPISSDASSPLYLKQHKYRVTEKDIIQLESVNSNTKSVSQNSGMRGEPYQVGDLFNFTSHQFRHTFAWFIIANRLGDLDDIKYQFKHLRNSMTLVYSERGYDSLSNLRSIIDYFEDLLNEHAIEDIIESASENSISGGGGQRLASIIGKLNDGSVEIYFSNDDQPIFDSINELSDFVTRHSDGVRGLPHGYCLKGIGCKIKNAADPSHCLYCDTYYVTPKHLPYWLSIKNNCERKIKAIYSLEPDKRKQYFSFLTALEDNLLAANEVVGQITGIIGNTQVIN